MRAVPSKRPRARTAERVETAYIPLVGGEDLVSPALSINPGALMFSENYEPGIVYGYRRVDGFERTGGSVKPSAATYSVLNFDAGSADFAVGDIVEGGLYGATGEVLAVSLESGTWGGGNAAGYLVLFNIVGEFADNEPITATGGAAVVNGAVVERGASNDTDDSTWMQGAIDAVRADILAIPGSGPIRGTWVYNGVMYAFRDNTDATACLMYQAPLNPQPTTMDAVLLSFTSGGTTEITASMPLFGATSNANLIVHSVQVTSGTWAGGDAAGYLVCTVLDGPVVAENLLDAPAGNDMCSTPGNGTDVTVWSGLPQAGWVEVDTGDILDFTSGGTAEIVVGQGIIGSTSGASGVVRKVVVSSGTWAGGDAAGYLVLSGKSGTFVAETIQDGPAPGDLASVAGDSTAVTLLPGGRYEFINENFYGSTATRRMYGCDGVNPAFEFDGTTFLQIATGMADDAPIHIIEFKKHLFLAFRLGSVQHAAPGEPLVWDVIVGAAEIATGDEITGFSSVPGGVLAIFNRNQTYLLYGSSVADWELKLHAEDSGAVEWSIQSIGAPRYLDDRGMTSLNAVQSFGDFAASTFSQKIQPLLDVLMRDSSVTASVRVRTKDQYRIFFADGRGVIAKFRPKSIEFTRINYGMVVRCACSVEDTTGREVLLFGSDDGYVYKMDSGTSFDGEAIVGYLRLPFWHMKSPQQNKRFFKAVLEIDAPGGTDLEFTQEFNYGNTDTPIGLTQTLDVQSGGGQWGSLVWGSFIFGAQIVGTAEGYLDGGGTNINLIRSTSIYGDPHTINGINLHYSMRGLAR